MNGHWQGVEMADSTLFESKLQNTVFQQVHFINVSFKEAQCQGCTFEQCTFDQCLFFGTDLSSATFIGCKFNRSKLEHAKTQDFTITP
jgi:uncharacterized protein YjbI with pentapeptide repeats